MKSINTTAAQAATPVIKLLGKSGIDDLSFTNVNGSHGTADWDTWLKFMDTYLKPTK
jgi:hypothetical protein